MSLRKVFNFAAKVGVSAIAGVAIKAGIMSGADVMGVSPALHFAVAAAGAAATNFAITTAQFVGQKKSLKSKEYRNALLKGMSTSALAGGVLSYLVPGLQGLLEDAWQSETARSIKSFFAGLTMPRLTDFTMAPSAPQVSDSLPVPDNGPYGEYADTQLVMEEAGNATADAPQPAEPMPQDPIEAEQSPEKPDQQIHENETANDYNTGDPEGDIEDEYTPYQEPDVNEFDPWWADHYHPLDQYEGDTNYGPVRPVEPKVPLAPALPETPVQEIPAEQPASQEPLSPQETPPPQETSPPPPESDAGIQQEKEITSLSMDTPFSEWKAAMAEFIPEKPSPVLEDILTRMDSESTVVRAQAVKDFAHGLYNGAYGLPKVREAAFVVNKLAIEISGGQNAQAVFNEAYSYLHGIGTEPDYEKARQGFVKAITLGYHSACDNLNYMEKVGYIDRSGCYIAPQP